MALNFFSWQWIYTMVVILAASALWGALMHTKNGCVREDKEPTKKMYQRLRAARVTHATILFAVISCTSGDAHVAIFERALSRFSPAIANGKYLLVLAIWLCISTLFIALDSYAFDLGRNVHRAIIDRSIDRQATACSQSMNKIMHCRYACYNCPLEAEHTLTVTQQEAGPNNDKGTPQVYYKLVLRDPRNRVVDTGYAAEIKKDGDLCFVPLGKKRLDA